MMGDLIQVLTHRLRSSGEQLALTLLAYVAVFLLILFAFAAFIYAAATALTAAYGPVVSASILGGASLVLALIVFAVIAARKRRLRRLMRMRRPSQPAMAGAAATVLPLMLRASPIGTLLVVAAAGYILQRSTQRAPK
jgi:Mn2+/Fe2+ NRAMP family transporter